MAIDPMMYKKYSGRSGDPYAKLGAALAQSDAHDARREAMKDRNARTWVSPVERFKADFMGIMLLGIAIGFIVLIVAIFS